jgi:hypothetical protein
MSGEKLEITFRKQNTGGVMVVGVVASHVEL